MATSEDHLTNWDHYQSAWADISDAERTKFVEAAVDPDCSYTDPDSVSYGYGELVKKMEATQRNFPGARFRNDKFVDHHDQAISNWTMFDGEGQVIFVGTSYARYSASGRLTDMIGFFEPGA